MPENNNEATLLPLGTVVILQGSLKQLMIVSRGNILAQRYFDYGAVLFPEGLVDANLAYFNAGDIVKVVAEGHHAADEDLLLDQLAAAKAEFLAQPAEQPAPITPSIADDPFAAVREGDANGE
ncbi:DUF4176 domain-containing protein [Lacticaseibacillus absianus]|uniref:DUF4176 domain-containing protein n=1 Tax=Lacticaseibacillus absianus TaxID=2729623 RepID=UPI0015C8F236|nr:DUF4176 domain-containing protein [Lacticaseibacillus absianus]